MVRLKTRYIYFKITQINDSAARPTDPARGRSRGVKLDKAAVWEAIQRSLRDNFGTLSTGLLQSRLQLKYFNTLTASGILRTNRDNWRVAQGALTYVVSIENVACVITVLHISGTIKHIEQAVLKDTSEVISLVVD